MNKEKCAYSDSARFVAEMSEVSNFFYRFLTHFVKKRTPDS